jgi:anti-anti-sigma factor
MSASAPAGKVLHASHGGVHLLRFVGDIRHPMGPALERFLDRWLSEEPAGGLVIDFSETRIIDSTCLGLLARLAVGLRAQGRPKATVVSPLPDVTEVLRSMSFDRLFEIVGEMPVDLPGGRPVPTPGARDSDALLATMLGAHRTLMALSERNRLEFKDVVEALERESESRRDRKDH